VWPSKLHELEIFSVSVNPVLEHGNAMTDPAHLNEVHSNTTNPLSKKLVETFRNAVRDPSVAKTDYLQRVKNEMEAALQEEFSDAASEPNNP